MLPPGHVRVESSRRVTRLSTSGRAAFPAQYRASPPTPQRGTRESDDRVHVHTTVHPRRHRQAQNRLTRTQSHVLTSWLGRRWAAAERAWAESVEHNQAAVSF